MNPLDQIPLFPVTAEETAPTTLPVLENNDSQYVVYVDESGDHSLVNVDKNYPVFVLAFCIFFKEYYAQKVVPAVEQFKFRHFGHDIIVLHEADIRKEVAPFNIFGSRQHQQVFLNELNGIIASTNFILISSVIRKDQLSDKVAKEKNPYHLALQHCIEGLHDFLLEKNQQDKRTHIVVECRGKKEDRELELEFRRICDGENKFKKNLPYVIVLADKKTNSTGLQLADLVARPIGRHCLDRKQVNRAFNILKTKLFCKGGRNQLGKDYEGWGLRVFPAPESEKPR